MKFAKVLIYDLGKIVTGKTPSTKTPAFWGGPIPFVTPEDLQKDKHVSSTARTLSEEGVDAVESSTIPARSVCVSCIGNIGYVAITTSRSVTNQQINSIVPSKDYDSDFVFYLMKELWPTFKRLESSGTSVPILNKSNFSLLPVFVPSLPEQRAIAGVLSTLDDKIELNRKICKELEETAKLIYDYWFVQFDFPDARGRPYRSSGGKMVYSPILKRDIPEGWEESTFGANISMHGGKQIQPSDFLPDGAFAVYGGNGIQGYLNRNSEPGFVIAFGRVGAYCGSIHWTYHGAWINNNASALLPRDFEEYWLMTLLAYDMTSLRKGSAQPFIPNSNLSNAPILNPDTNVKGSFCKICEPLLRAQESYYRESRELSSLRDWLLPLLLSGQVAVTTRRN